MHDDINQRITFNFVTIIVMHNPNKAITAKEYRRFASAAIYPISGGPSRNPRNPILDTLARAIPGAILVAFAAVL